MSRYRLKGLVALTVAELTPTVDWLVGIGALCFDNAPFGLFAGWFCWFSASLADHDLDNLAIRVNHAFASQGTEISDRGVDAIFDDPFVT